MPNLESLIEKRDKHRRELKSLLSVHSCGMNKGICSRPRSEKCQGCPVQKEFDGE